MTFLIIAGFYLRYVGGARREVSNHRYEGKPRGQLPSKLSCINLYVSVAIFDDLPSLERHVIPITDGHLHSPYAGPFNEDVSRVWDELLSGMSLVLYHREAEAY